jgi:6-phosphofructokinase 1
MIPKSYITADGFGITPAARRYLAPLIQGEDYPPFDKDGLPKYVKMKKVLARKKLDDFEV